jgi:hypothetical protein
VVLPWPEAGAAKNNAGQCAMADSLLREDDVGVV